MRGTQFDQAEARGPKPGRALVLLLTIAAAAAAAAPARAQSLADLAAYSGPDRTQRLVDGARKEGTLTVYSSMTVADLLIINLVIILIALFFFFRDGEAYSRFARIFSLSRTSRRGTTAESTGHL